MSFAEKLAKINAQCEEDQTNGIQNSKYCINERFRTANGGGDFNPFDNSVSGCLKLGLN